MKSKTIPTVTPESVWALLHEIAERQAESERMLTERFVESERILTERFKETNRQIAENERIYSERQAKLDKQMAETDKQMSKTDKQISRLEKQVGGITNNNGAFAEEYFVNSLRKGNLILFGEKFDKLIKSVIMIDDKNRIRGEIDTLLLNGKAVAIFETKYRARENNIDHVLKKVKIFRDRFPEYANHKLYLGIASMVFDKNIEQKCIENGIAIIKQVGDTIVVYDENLKTF
ncbi:MAG: hypothetical protein FWH18_10545 [Marinilabiliaceae bacterium]|nr:hypothetical protein [Marinilabiliaceae bacterium]